MEIILTHLFSVQDAGEGLGFSDYFLFIIKPMKFFKYESDHFFKKHFQSEEKFDDQI